MRKIQKCHTLIQATFASFRKDDGLTLAAALSFYAILSLIPLSMIVVSLLGHFLGRSDEALNRIIQILTDVIPDLTPLFIENLKLIVSRKLSSGWLGVLILFLVASLLFTNLEKTLDKIFKSERSRNFFHSRLLAIAFIVASSLLLFVPAILKNIDDYLMTLHIPISLTALTGGHLFFFLGGMMTFLLILWVVPNHQVQWKYNLSGALLFASLLIAVKYVFRWYILFSLDRLNLVYGSLTALILIILWIFYFMTLFVICAECVGVLQRQNHAA